MHEVDDDFVIDDIAERYNVSPASALPCLYQQQTPRAAMMHWGLLPLWAKPGVFSRALINARAETVFEKPSFRALIKQSRCVILANGFYEWRRSENARVPFYFSPADSDVLCIAGISQFNKQGNAECCIITRAADAIMQPVHDRMPVLLAREQITGWLQCDKRESIEARLHQVSPPVLRKVEVSSFVNRATNDGARCISPVYAGLNRVR